MQTHTLSPAHCSTRQNGSNASNESCRFDLCPFAFSEATLARSFARSLPCFQTQVFAGTVFHRLFWQATIATVPRRSLINGIHCDRFNVRPIMHHAQTTLRVSCTVSCVSWLVTMPRDKTTTRANLWGRFDSEDIDTPSFVYFGRPCWIVSPFGWLSLLLQGMYKITRPGEL